MHVSAAGRGTGWLIQQLGGRGTGGIPPALVGNTGKCLVLGHHVARWEEFGEV